MLIRALAVCPRCGKSVRYSFDERLQQLHPADVVARMVAKEIAAHAPACAAEFVRKEPVA